MSNPLRKQQQRLQRMRPLTALAELDLDQHTNWITLVEDLAVEPGAEPRMEGHRILINPDDRMDWELFALQHGFRVRIEQRGTN